MWGEEAQLFPVNQLKPPLQKGGKMLKSWKPNENFVGTAQLIFVECLLSKEGMPKEKALKRTFS